MNGQRSADRIRLVMVLAIVVAMALGSFWVLQVVRKGLNESMPNMPRNEPDYYVEQFKFVRMTNTGHVHYAVSGARLTHNPQNSSFEIQQPVIKSLSDNQPPITARADRAVSEENNSKVHLYDNVIVDRPASGTAEHFQFTSDYMLALPDDDVVETDKPVKMVLGTSILTGTGMYANNATREFKLLSKVRGIFQPSLVH
ncbi:MAG TPA: LPS export ABC transporter periplasmic protein LptC [Burkholderiaceae bacterium]|jgi:lipopolysaccharide export system protein LptC